MILYLDTSAILKRYFQEPFSEDVAMQWNSAEAIVSSSVAYAETVATIYRKKKDADLDDAIIQETIEIFTSDWSSFIQVEVTNDLNPHLDNLLKKYELRGFDAIHLASAFIIYEQLPLDFFFACFDHRLNQAAKLEGFESF